MLPASIKVPESMNFETPSFICEGVTYYRTLEKISNVRVERYLTLAPALSLSTEFSDIYGFIVAIYSELGEMHIKANAYSNVMTKLANIIKTSEGMNAEKLTYQQVDIVWQVCSLFIVRAGEDMLVIDEALMQDKIDSWKREMDFFGFFFFVHKLPHLFSQS